jgi:hypothetical protein
MPGPVVPPLGAPVVVRPIGSQRIVLRGTLVFVEPGIAYVKPDRCRLQPVGLLDHLIVPVGRRKAAATKVEDDAAACSDQDAAIS